MARLAWVCTNQKWPAWPPNSKQASHRFTANCPSMTRLRNAARAIFWLAWYLQMRRPECILLIFVSERGWGVYLSRNGPDEIPCPDVLLTVVSKALVIFQRLTLFRV